MDFKDQMIWAEENGLCGPDEAYDYVREARADHADSEREKCTCWYGAYVRHGGGTGWDIARYDPACPSHGGGDGGEEGTVSTS